MKRCEWGQSSELMMQYHDEEWGNPIHDDKALFEFLTLQYATLSCRQQGWLMTTFNGALGRKIEAFEKFFFSKEFFNFYASC